MALMAGVLEKDRQPQEFLASLSEWAGCERQPSAYCNFVKLGLPQSREEGTGQGERIAKNQFPNVDGVYTARMHQV